MTESLSFRTVKRSGRSERIEVNHIAVEHIRKQREEGERTRKGHSDVSFYFICLRNIVLHTYERATNSEQV